MEEKSPTSGERVLIVEDDDALRELLSDEVRDTGLQVVTARSAEGARALIETDEPDLIVSDLRLPGADGMKLLAHVRTLPAPPAFIVITGFGTIPQAVEALKAGADDFLTKPLNLDHFILAVSRSLENRRLRREVQRFKELLGDDHFHGIIGRSRPMRVLFDQIRRVSKASSPVLIVGESGVGKELVARALHEESPRAEGPFLAVNCAGVPHDLLESEFFGHAKGAFTGASRRREGLFVEAGGGTLLLDEIAEMPVALQAKLLRVLQEGVVRPVGSSQGRPVDVRILAATNRDLEEEMDEGRFRRDLFYRLEAFQLHVPPLRERGEDRDLLVNHFLSRVRARQDKPIEGVAPNAMQALESYPFPGNVRELENAIERAVTFCDTGRIEVEHLPERIRAGATLTSLESRPDDLVQSIAGDAEELPTMAQLERRYIEYVLDRVEGNKRRAAKLLGIGRRTLYRRLDEHQESDSSES